MSVLCGKSILKHIPITPMVEVKTRHELGTSYGLDEAGYSLRLSDKDESSDAMLDPGLVHLGVTMEHLEIPNNVIAYVYNKSTYARLGLLMPTTTLEPGWKGHITLELIYFNIGQFKLYPGMPIAQVCFHWLDGEAIPYTGKYQDQPEAPVPPRF